MKIQVTSDVNIQEILTKKGLGPDKGLQKYMAARIKMRCDPYVPKQSGTLKNTARILNNGTGHIYLRYSQPYAHYQYYGSAMAGRAPKHYTGKPLQYQEAPMRGPRWDQRMMADHRQDLEADAAAYMNRKDGPL